MLELALCPPVIGHWPSYLQESGEVHELIVLKEMTPVEPNLPIGELVQLELYLLDLSLNILIGKAEVHARGVAINIEEFSRSFGS